jgi:ribosome maturation factor RimP
VARNSAQPGGTANSGVMGFMPFFYLCFPIIHMSLQELIESTVTGLGYELVMVELSPRSRLMRVFIDAPEKPRGVDVEDCATVSNQLTHLFQVENIDYDRLEVSSPGLDRPLVKPADYSRFAGSQVQIKLRMPIGERRQFNGTLKGIEGDQVELELGENSITFPLSNIDKARLVPKF